MEGLGSFLLFAILFYVLMRYGCGAHMIHGGHGGDSKDEKNHDHAESKAVDPVCGMAIEEEQGYGKMYEGNLYRFCSRNCLDKFETDPQPYTNKLVKEKG